MMEFGKITIFPKSPFITPLQSDTIFGHFAWAYAYKYGQSSLEEIMESFDEKPFIVFSDGFLQGYLPRPFLKPVTFKCDQIENAKRIKKATLVQKEFLFKNLDNLTEKKIVEHLQNLDLPPTSKHSITQKNSIDRDSLLVTEGLYTIKETFFYPKISYEIYFAYDDRIEQAKIEETFEVMAARGYGKDKSAGKGRFDFTIDWNFEEKKYFAQKRSKYINLSTMFYNSSKMKLLYGKTITKFPKAGGSYANSEPFKNPCIMFTPGSTFLVNEEAPYGKAEEGVYNKPKHYQNGYSIGIYFDGEDQ